MDRQYACSWVEGYTDAGWCTMKSASRGVPLANNMAMIHKLTRGWRNATVTTAYLNNRGCQQAAWVLLSPTILGSTSCPGLSTMYKQQLRTGASGVCVSHILIHRHSVEVQAYLPVQQTSTAMHCDILLEQMLSAGNCGSPCWEKESITTLSVHSVEFT